MLKNRGLSLNDLLVTGSITNSKQLQLGAELDIDDKNKKDMKIETYFFSGHTAEIKR